MYIYINIYIYIYIYIYICIEILPVWLSWIYTPYKASDTQAIGRGFEPRLKDSTK